MRNILTSLGIALLPLLTCAQGTIIQDTLILQLSTQDIEDLLTAQGLPTGVLALDYPVDVHRIVYNTPDPNGNPTYASGLVFIPTGVECPLPLFTYMHGTKIKKLQTFYYLADEWFLGAVMASSGYVTSMPDYLGLGFSPGLHPYQHARSEATSTVDLLRVARTICEEESRPLNGQLFLTGYSQGGHACMATHRMIQQELAEEFTVTAAAPGSGPYYMSGHQLDMVAAFDTYAVPGYLPYLIIAYQSVYGNLYTDYADIFAPPYDETLPPMINGEFDMWELNLAMPDTPRLAIREDYAELFFNDTLHPAYLALKDNDVYDWVPNAPVLLNYCGSDEEVTPLNTLFTEQHMNMLGATNVTSIERSSTLGHFECANPTLLFSKIWFDGMVEWCTSSVGENSGLASVSIYPNPVTDGILQLTNTTPLDVTLSDMSGRVMLRTRAIHANATVEVKGCAPGMYLVTLSNGQAQQVQRVVIQ